jgi:hypothetical protein
LSGSKLILSLNGAVILDTRQNGINPVLLLPPGLLHQVDDLEEAEERIRNTVEAKRLAI